MCSHSLFSAEVELKAETTFAPSDYILVYAASARDPSRVKFKTIEDLNPRYIVVYPKSLYPKPLHRGLRSILPGPQM